MTGDLFYLVWYAYATERDVRRGGCAYLEPTGLFAEPVLRHFQDDPAASWASVIGRAVRMRGSLDWEGVACFFCGETHDPHTHEATGAPPLHGCTRCARPLMQFHDELCPACALAEVERRPDDLVASDLLHTLVARWRCEVEDRARRGAR